MVCYIKTSETDAYGSECWPVSKKNGNVLRIFERRIVKIIYGPVNDNGIWKTRYSNELYTHYNKIDLARVVIIERLRLLGHRFRMQKA
jgi:hypothetical protein